MKPALYWVIKCRGNTYWHEEGGVTLHQREAERFESIERARSEIQKWCHPDEKAWPVRIVARQPR